MFEDFQTLDIDTGMARIHGRHGGSGPPLLLLHGNPMTHVTWHRLVPELARRFHVVATDLRGYGDSSAPPAGENNINYAFRAMAEDQVQVMRKLGYDRFRVAGHDRGARVAHRMALDHPGTVEKVALIDILPSHYIWNHVSREWAQSSWHWVFMTQPEGFPERMMEAVPADWFMTQKLSKPGIGLDFMDPAAFAEYVRCFNAKTIRGSCADYRACLTCDLEMDTRDFDAGHMIDVPTLVVWGAKSHTGIVYGDALGVWRQYARRVEGGAIACGHYVQEEAPRETLDRLMKFFRLSER
jgi:haloacetate dehalogenase